MYKKLNHYIKDNTLIAIFFIGLLSIFVLYIKEWIGLFSKFMIILNPILIGLILAFLINVPMKWIENVLFPKTSLKSSLKRLFSLSLTLFLGILFIILFINIIVPDIQKTINIIQTDMPIFMENINKFYNQISQELNLSFNFSLDYSSLFKKIDINAVIDSILGATTSVFDIIINFGLGLVFSIHLLLNKEIVKTYTRNIIKKICYPNIYKKMRKWYLLTKETFSKFLVGQVSDACLLGIICYIIMKISGIPYASVICLTIAITALIPILGGWIGSLLGFILIFFISPMKAILFIIEFVVIQWIDNNFIYPKVVGNSIGLESVFVIFAIIIGGGIAGPLGMLLAIPCMSVVIIIINEWLEIKIM